MPPNTEAITAAIAAVLTAAPGRQRQVRINRVLRLAVDLDAEKETLERRLERMWELLDEMCRKSEIGPEYEKRERLCLKTLKQYEAACDALHEARTVLR